MHSARRLSLAAPRYPLSRIARNGIRSMASAPRGDYATLTEDDVKHFAGILAPTSIVTSLPPFNHPQSDLDSYNDDWLGKYHGRSKLVLKPKTTAEVSAVMKHCYNRKLAIVPQGGNTGLVGTWLPSPFVQSSQLPFPATRLRGASKR
jgi:hypothetical protein